jgi:hypothetical protein
MLVILVCFEPGIQKLVTSNGFRLKTYRNDVRGAVLLFIIEAGFARLIC